MKAKPTDDARNEAVEAGLKAHYAICEDLDAAQAKIIDLEQSVAELKANRQAIEAGIRNLYHRYCQPSGVPNIGNLAKRIEELNNAEETGSPR